VSPNPSTAVPMATLILGLTAVDVSRVVLARELTRTVVLLRTAEINDTTSSHSRHALLAA